MSLAAVLRPVAGLAGRWRRLELASWKGLLDRTVAAFAEGKCTWILWVGLIVTQYSRSTFNCTRSATVSKSICSEGPGV